MESILLTPCILVISSLQNYRLVKLPEKIQIAKSATYEAGLPNKMNFIGICHAIGLLEKLNTMPIYTNNTAAIAMVKNTVERGVDKRDLFTLDEDTGEVEFSDEETEKLYKAIAKCEAFLQKTTFNLALVMKWDTKNWGEISK